MLIQSKTHFSHRFCFSRLCRMQSHDSGALGDYLPELKCDPIIYAYKDWQRHKTVNQQCERLCGSSHFEMAN